MTIRISEVFSPTPGARFVTDGEFSGEEFRETILIPQFQEAIKNREKLIIDLDGGYGYATSFLEESFGGLARKFSVQLVLDTLDFISDDEPVLVDSIKRFINSANNTRKIGARCEDR